jgi:hypothetical protein
MFILDTSCPILFGKDKDLSRGKCTVTSGRYQQYDSKSYFLTFGSKPYINVNVVF